MLRLVNVFSVLKIVRLAPYYNGHSLSTNDNKLKTDHDHRLK